MAVTDEEIQAVLQQRWEQGRRVASLRALHGLLQKDLAEYIGYDRSHVSAIEHGRRNLTDQVAIKLAELLRTTPEYLLRGER